MAVGKYLPLPTGGVVFQHDDELITTDTKECPVDITFLRETSTRPTIILHSGNDDGR